MGRGTLGTGDYWTPRFAAATFGLAGFAVVILIATLVVGDLSYSLPVVVLAVVALVHVVQVISRWRSAAWVRESVAAKRALGSPVWPVRAESVGGRWTRTGTLEADETGVTVAVESGEVHAAWSDLKTLELADAGAFYGERIVLEGPRAGRLELDLLRLNATERESAAALRECLRSLLKLRSAKSGPHD